MKAAIYNPYLDTLGGGERYTLAFAKALLSEGYTVDLEWESPEIIKKLEDRFGMSLKGINVLPSVKKGDGYDLCFWVSDGSIPLMHARNNILHFQVPFHKVNGRSLMNKMKLFRINTIVCNSEFTKKIIDKEFGVNSVVIYPPVDTKQFKAKRKENIILYVGRFSKILQSKKQDILISAFKKFHDDEHKDWKLILAGGSEVGSGDFLKELKEMSNDYPIEIIESPRFDTLKTLYGKSKIFWSAAGFGVNEESDPELMEHFGITVVEAMSSGVVPIVFNGGGYKEIVNNGINGYLWTNTDELLERTEEVVSSSKELHVFETQAKKRAEDFTVDNFNKRISSYILP